MQIDLYQTVTDRIVAQLEAGTVPWVQPWNGSHFGMPVNAETKRAYSGVNVLLLWGAQERCGFSRNLWLTFKQALDLGGNVRKGEKSPSFVIKVGQVRRLDEKSGEETAATFLKSYAVFNIAQCEGIPLEEEPAPLSIEQRHADADALIAATGARIEQYDRAFYSRALDYVGMPAFADFCTAADYYATVLHELTHWTGHEKRLAREFGKRFADTAYAREELVAEMGSAFMCAHLGIEPKTRHVDYLAHWAALLKEDKRAIVQAASAASKAADHIIALAAQPARLAA